VIADALESGKLPNETQTALEDFVVNITDEHASGYADQARHLLALGLRRIIADSPDGLDADDEANDDDDEPEEEMNFNLCDYQDLKLDFQLSEGGDKVFSFSLHRDPSTHERGRGFADICFYTFGEKDTSFLYEGVHLPRHEAATEHSQSIIVSGRGRVNFTSRGGERLISLHWNEADDELDGSFDIYEGDEVVQFVSFIK
jgi:hypothetical protein